MAEEERLSRIEDKVDELRKEVERLDKDFARYRGLVGGVLLAVTAIVTFIKYVWEMVKQ